MKLIRMLMLMFVPWFFSARNNLSLLLSHQVQVISLLWHTYTCHIENTRNIYISCSGLCSYKLGHLAGRYPSLFCSHHQAAAPLWAIFLRYFWDIFALLLCLTSPPFDVALLATQMRNPAPSLPAASAGDAASYACYSFPPSTDSILSADT